MTDRKKMIRVIIISILVFTAVLTLDMITKSSVRKNFPMNQYPGKEISIFGEWLTIIHVENDGVAFSIPIPMLEYISVIALLVIGFFFYKTIKEEPEAWYNYYAFAFIAAGAVGNFIDRLARGMVTDMIKVDLGFRPFNPFAIFNIADSAVTTGVCIFIVFNLIHDIKNRREAEQSGV